MTGFGVEDLDALCDNANCKAFTIIINPAQRAAEGLEQRFQGEGRKEEYDYSSTLKVETVHFQPHNGFDYTGVASLLNVAAKFPLRRLVLMEYFRSGRCYSFHFGSVIYELSV